MSVQTTGPNLHQILAKLDVNGKSWVAILANYHFQMNYKTDRTNIDVNALSGIPWDHTLDSETVKAIINITQSNEVPSFKTYVRSAIQLHKVDVNIHPTKMTPEQWKEWLEDPHFGEIHKLCKQNKLLWCKHRKAYSP